MATKQMNLNVTPEFEADLERLMKARGSESKSELVRQVIHEAAQATAKRRDWESLAGVFADGKTHHPDDEDELWEGTGV